MVGQSISIPQGSYTALYVLGMSTGYYESMAGVVTAGYTDQSSDQYTLGVSDWKNGYTETPGSTAPGESIVATMSQHDTWNGTQDVSTTGSGNTVYVYGYVIPVDPSRTLQSLSLPNNNMAIFAIDVVNTQARQQIAMAPTGGSSALGSASPLSVRSSATSASVAADLGAPAFSGPADPAYRCFTWTATSPGGKTWASPANDAHDESVAPTAQTAYPPPPALSYSALATGTNHEGAPMEALTPPLRNQTRMMGLFPRGAGGAR